MRHLTEQDSSAPALSEWLHRAARKAPEHPALDAPDGVRTWGRLHQEVLALAARLREAGFAPGDRVAIAAERTPQTLVAILAAVEAGVAYVPLDLAYPAGRLEAMLGDALPRAVLGAPEALARLRDAVGALPTLEQPAPRGPAPHAAAEDLCYVLFTSGSTGRPKGVAMGGGPLRELIDWHARHARLSRPARTLQFAPLSFDVHFQEIFSTLACGGTLVLIDEARRRDPARLLQCLREQRVERLFLPYVALQMLAEAVRDEAALPPLRDVVSAGEQLQITPAIRALFERLPDCVLHNHYGPTESHVVTAHELAGPARDWPEIPPIGSALPHVKLALRDPDSKAALPADAASGELLLGGNTLAHGYLGRAELSAERFRDDLPGLPGRWYLTGDLVERDAVGGCRYLGRADQQIKIDGFRVEAGEVELALMAHEGVRDAVVTAPELPGAGRQLVAHVVPRAGDGADLAPALRAHLRQRLPEYMVPARFVVLDRLPTTPSGKIDRSALPLPAAESAAGAARDAAQLVRSLWQELLGLSALGDSDNLFDLGARSLLVLRFVTRLKECGVQGLTVADVYDRPTLAGLCAALQGAAPVRSVSAPQRSAAGTEKGGIAIVGIATRTAGAPDVEAFWQGLLDGREGIRHFAPHELDPSVPESVRSRPNFVAARGTIDDPARFDAAFFGIPAREATLLDPQQRLFLELCWSALEHAALDPARLDARVGVYGGVANNSYIAALREEQPQLIRQAGEFAAMLASEKDYVATRVANRLNLDGPAVSVHTACSTGLVAVALAAQALASGQCDIALAGGATVIVPQEGGYLHVEGAMESADGHCRPFDADASGTVFASGGAVVALRRLEDALAAGDTVFAVIRGVGLNNDGGDKASFTAPSVSGQAGAIRMALRQAGVSARSIGYVEAHGTGTALGDPIEVAALARAWREDTADTQFCGLGSVKGHLGHTIAAAGVLGLVKTALALQRECIPGTLHYRRPNLQIDFAATPFRIVAGNTLWPRCGEPRRAAVSSFGVGGTNAHLVLEEAPQPARPAAPDAARLFLLPLSARTPTAALRRARDLADHLERHPALPLADVAATLMRGRRPMASRAAAVARDLAGAVAALRALKSTSTAFAQPRLVFLFPGQGSQHPGMARGLHDEVPAFREALDRCLALAAPALTVDLKALLVDADPADEAAARLLAETCHAQPALFAMSHALAAWLDTLGVQPHAMIGHSIGEYAAACQAGVMPLEDAVAAVLARGQAMFEQPRGAMLAVRTGAEALAPLLPAGVEIAGCNAPALTVVAGDAAAIDACAVLLEAREIGCTRLRVSHAFHSASMEAALPRVAQALGRARLQAPRLPVYSCVSGAPLATHEATDPQYWARQVRAPVLFSRAVQAELAQDGDTVFVEVGPGQALTALLRQHRTRQGGVPSVVPLLGTPQQPGDPAVQALGALGALWCAGIGIDWPVAANARRLPLPTYPFEGERHWFARRTTAPAAAPDVPALPPAPAVSSTPAEVPTPMSRLPRLEQELTRLLSDVSGLAAEDIARDASFVDQGLDSLSLTQATLELERVFGVKLRFRRLLEDLCTVGKLAAFLDGELPPGRFAPPPAVAAEPVPAPAAITGAAVPVRPAMAPAVAGGVQELIQQQMQLMAQQLALLTGMPAPQTLAASPATSGGPAATAPQPGAAPEPVQPSARALVDKPFGASARITLDARPDFTPAQARWLDDFIARYNARTGRSKAFSQQHRKVMADPRVVTGFNPLWKDLVYPIVADRSAGARLWDLDGNEYIDLLSCFGANLLGYQPSELVQAMAQQLQAGIEVGPQHPLAAEVATLIAEFTGMERVAFCNTGSEAVMGAMRIARTVTGRKTIAIFTNSYHGIFDEVIVRGTRQLRSLSAAPGILANAVENVLVLDYASEESLQVLRERGPELAAIMIEPIQNKIPTLRPHDFVRALRRIADEAGCALIFDEVVTGFRVAPGGAQEFYGVRADIATYGKVIGGGLPFAAIAGKSHWLDALDGGHWQYGDDSHPEAGVTYFAGTFVRHPLALAAARATLLHLKRGGRELYRTLSERTQGLIDRLNTAFAVRGAPVKAVHCASLWRLHWDDNQKFVGLFYYLVRFHGLHLYEQFGHFVTEAMGEPELDRIFEVFTQALDELMLHGFIPPREGTPPPIPPKDKPAVHPSEGPLAPGQTERWLAAGFDASARRALNESFCVSLVGGVDLPALKAALQDVLTRHEAFRVRFGLDEPRQTLAAPGPVPVAEIDLRGQPDADAALDAFCSEASARDFPLDRAPLAALSLLHLSDGRVVVHVVASHLVFDGWASSVFNAELAEAYRARSTGRAPVLPAAESPLAFAAKELARLEGPAGQADLKYWQALLRDPPAPLALGDREPPSPRRYAGDTLRARFDGELHARMRARARQSGATLFQWLLAAVTTMLRRESGRDEFLVCIPYASQSLERHGPLMADGVLDLPLRLSCSATDSGEAVLQRVRSRLMDALEHPLVTQGGIARALRLRSAGDRPPLTGVFFNLNPRVDLSGFAPLVATMHEGRKRGTISELFFNFYEKDEALTLDLHYSTEFFSPERAQALVDALKAGCEALAGEAQAPAAPEPVSAIESFAALVASAPAVLRPAPAPQAGPQVDPRLRQWNATGAALEPKARVEQWVARQAARSPDAVALVARGSTLSYRELEARANRFAQLLRSRGIGAGMRVGLCLGRGPDLVPALLGVLKTGAAYVPLDPGFPRERLQYMAEDAGVKLVVTEAAHADLSGVPRERQLRIDEDAAQIAAASDAPLPAAPQWPDDATAYVIYTSGSTGRPKGVVLPQHAVCNFLASMQRTPGLAAGDRLLAVTTLSFDIAVLELLLPLSVGARVVLAQREEAMDGEVLGRLIGEHGINVMQATPTTWHMLLDAGWSAPAGFRALCGGEALPPGLAERLLAQGIELWNMYGPTETTVWSTLARIADAKQRITVGRPIDNTQVWILDEQLRPCPVGAEGEICIGGAGVATGYHQRPELTAERFVPDPFSGAAGARLYRTGDLGRWREDGTIEHLGRLDFQVKIRGYRIELGEIEARLAALPGVARTVVVAREDQPGDVRLVAYFVPQAGSAPDPAALRESLRGGLPDYMLPQFVVPLDALPLLPNGKIDRKALPEPSGPALASAQAGEPPRDDTERAVAQAMQAVLKLPQIGIRDDFFSLGGHSLLAARMIGQINRELGVQLNLRALFEAPTVEKLAQVVERQRGAGAPTRAPIVRRARQDSAPLTLMQERIRFIEEMQPGSVMYNAPSCHRLRGPMDLAAFDRAFQEMVRRQGALRTSIQRSGEGYVQRVDDAVRVSLLPVVDLSALPESEREDELLRQMDELLATTFALDQGPLVRTLLFRLADDHHALFFLTHHIVWDGWSFDLFYNEMSALYEAFRQGKPSPLPELPVSYGDFAEWHNAWMKSEEIAQQMAYWQRQFAQSPLPAPIPTDLPRTQTQSGRGATEFMRIPTEKAERIRDLAKQTGSTLSIVALSVYAALVSQWMREPRPAIGLPVRGRPSAELENIMGFFNNMVPLRLPVDPSLSCLDWIRSVRKQVTEVFANQDVPFELLSRELGVQGRGGRGRLYQVMFSFQDARQRPTHWGPLAHERIRMRHKGATEDLNLWMVEIPAGIESGLQYNADLFLPSTALALRDRLLAMFDRLVENPRQTVAELLAATPAEQQALERLARPAAPPPQATPDFLQAIEAQARQAPHSTALRDERQTVTREELVHRIQLFESRLGPLGVRTGGTVAVAISDPAAQLVASLAVLRAGRRCLSLDPHAPPAALRAALAATPVIALVADAALLEAAPQGAVAIDAREVPGCWHEVMSGGGANGEAQRVPEWPAADLPATPFGRSELGRLVGALSREAQLFDTDRLLSLDGRSRPLQLVEACLALSSGAKLVLAPASLNEDAPQLLSLVQAERIGWLHAPGRTWRRLLSAAGGRPLELLAVLDVPELAPDLAEALFAAGCTVLSMYRPPSLQLPVAAGWLAGTQDVALFGRPLGAVPLCIAERPGEALPAGVAAPLWTAGGAESAWVASGALCRWRSDGVLQYLGETGAGVWINGCRLDLQAVERQLGALPGVAAAGAVVTDDPAEHRRLTLLVEPAETGASIEKPVSDALWRALPAVAAASRVLQVQTLHRQADGRPDLDRSVVREPAAGAPQAPARDASLPATPTEQALAAAWAEVLGVRHIRLHDNFFELGGTSLLAMQVVARMEQQFGRQVSARRYVFESLGQLAAAYDQAGSAPAAPKPAVEAPAAPAPAGVMSRLARLVWRS